MKKMILIIALICGMSSMTEAQTVSIGANCTITWSANIENDLAGYRVYGTQGVVTKTVDIVKPTAATTCAALGTQAGGALTIQVDAVDLVGNRSPKSAPVIANQDIVGPSQPTGLSVTSNP